MKSKNWKDRQKKDIYVKNAKKEGYFSRSAFKLIEIDNKFKILKCTKKILELGSAPGGWSQVICNINKKVTIDAFDILEMKFQTQQIKFFNKNFLEFNFNVLSEKYDLILSDVAPNTIGHKSTDHLKIISLIEEIIYIVEDNLVKNGNFVFKLLQGKYDHNITNIMKNKFKKVTNFKPKSSRSESSEIYIIAQEFIPTKE